MKIVSLGTNCEVSFFIEQFTARKLDSYISSWARMNFDTIGALDLFDNLDNICDTTWTLLPWGMVKQNALNIGFHPKKSKTVLFDENGNVNQSEYAEALDELQSRLKHLCEKTKRLFEEEEQDILFVCKTEEDYENTLLYLAKLSKILKDKVKKADYVLLAFVTEGKAERLNAAAISKKLLVQDVDFLQSPPIKKRGGFDLENWQSGFYKAVEKLQNDKLERYNRNILENIPFAEVKSGDAAGSFDPQTKTIECRSSDHSYFGITYDLPLNAVVNKRLCLHVAIDEINSERKDLGYIQFWEKSKEKPEMYSAYLENVLFDKTDYLVWYTVPSDVTSLKDVLQAKNGSFKIKECTLKESLLN